MTNIHDAIVKANMRAQVRAKQKAKLPAPKDVSLALILHHPLTTEKSVAAIEKQNKITFIVDNTATKKTVKQRVEQVYSQKVKSVNMANTFSGKKKAIVAFVKEGAAADVAAKLKII